jgi:O-antigen/teichoic acid export membrane protein
LSRFATASQWAHRVLLAGGAQGVIQLVGFLAGVIVIRSLAPQQYAYYTIASSTLGVMTVLTDGGIANGVLAQGGQVWRERDRLGAVLAAGMALRRRLGIFALLVAVPLAILLLRHQGATWSQALLVAASMLPFFVLTVTGQLLEVVPRLQQRVAPLQGIQVVTNLARVGLVGLMVPLWPFAAVAMVGTAIPQWWANWRLRRLADVHADWRSAADAEVRQRLLAQVRRTLPGAIYYAVSGQLSIWLVAIFGAATSVAAVGALGRLAMILSAIGGVFNLLGVPRFARIPATQRALIRRRYLQTQTAFAAASAVPLAALALFPSPALSILGPSYAGLHSEAVLMAASYIVSSMSALAYILGASRGVVVAPWVSVPYCIVGQIVLISLLPLHEVAGVIWVTLLSEASLWLLHSLYFMRRTQ